MLNTIGCRLHPLLQKKLAATAFAASMIVAAPLAAGPAHAADNYPSRPVSLVLAYPPGGAVDFVGRLLARNLEAALSQTVIVENRPGGGSVIGTSVVTRAQPDGYTLLLADPALIINPSFMKSVPYDAKKDLVPISTVTVSPLVLVVPGEPKLKTLDDLIKEGKSRSSGLNFASAGLGTTPHMAGELLKARTETNLVHVPYKGSGPAMTDLVAGLVDFAFATQPAAVSYIGANRLHGLATTGAERSKRLPDLPTISETVPNFNVQFWTALFAPGGTPQPVLDKLNAAVRKTLETPDVLAALEKAGENPVYMSLDEASAFIAKEEQMWSKVVADGNLKQN